ncbi:MAG: AAA family ATPase [Chloroflexota bacterium]|nr:AAA family ATPase [Chloroflexota bacterium]
MHCSRCGTLNEAGRKFCRECGSRLGVSCPTCGTVETGGSKFCGECGTALPILGTGAAAATTAVGEQAITAAAERRLVSILFADLVGFTPLSESRDPEAVRELLTEYYDVAREVVGRYRGSIEKFIGDAVMAVWGAPVAREDDAERAVRCALDLVQSVAALGLRRALPELSARAGVYTGEAAVSVGATGQGLVAGDIVNTAARLQAAADPGTVIVGEATHRAAGRSIAFRRLPDLALKGKSDPVVAWQATHLVGAGGAQRSRAEVLEPPFVGRGAELQLLRELYHATVREGRARLVSVMGQAGIGKTRLAWELEKYVSGLAAETRWLQGRSPAYQEGISYWALAEMVRRAAGIAEEEDAASSSDKLSRLLAAEVPDANDRQWLEPRLAALLGIGAIPQGDRGELFGAWRALFERLAARAPLVLVFEDIHWADAGLLDFVESLLQWSRSFPILVITLARPELLEDRPTWGAGVRSFSSLHLDPLPEGEMRELLDGLAPGLPDSIVGPVVRRSEGVPLYAVETVRMLIDQGVLEPAVGGYRLVRSPERLALPETLHALIAARLDALPAPERRLLQDGSVLGQTFQRDALLAIAPDRGAAEVDQIVASLLAKELLRVETDPRSPERGQLGFVQGAIREVAYAGLARAERRARHAAAARYFIEVGDEDAVGIVASHMLAAYQAAPDHPDAAALREQARDYLLAAAERARRLHSYQQTLAYLEQALSVTQDSAERAAILERAGEVARAAGDRPSAERYLGQALDWYRQQADSTAIARAGGTLATALIDDVHIEQAVDLATEALAQLPSPDEPEAAPLMAALSRAHLNRGDWRATLEWAERALVVAERSDQVNTVVEALVNRATAVDGLGRPREAQAVLRGALVLAERYGAFTAALRATNNLVTLESEDSPAEAIRIIEAGLELGQRVGEVGWTSRFRHTLLEFRLARGEWNEVLDEIAALDEEAFVAHEWEHLHDNLAVVAAFRGERDRAQELLSRWVSQPERTVTQHETAHHLALAEVALAEGRLDEAQREGLMASRSPTHRLDGQFVAGRAALWLRDQVQLAAALHAYREQPPRSRLRHAQHDTLRAGLAALRDEDAASAYAAAIGHWSHLGYTLQLALAQLELATFGAAGDDAARAVNEARSALTRLGAEGLVERLRGAAALV